VLDLGERSRDNATDFLQKASPTECLGSLSKK